MTVIEAGNQNFDEGEAFLLDNLFAEERTLATESYSFTGSPTRIPTHKPTSNPTSQPTRTPTTSPTSLPTYLALVLQTDQVSENIVFANTRFAESVRQSFQGIFQATGLLWMSPANLEISADISSPTVTYLTVALTQISTGNVTTISADLQTIAQTPVTGNLFSTRNSTLSIINAGITSYNSFYVKNYALLTANSLSVAYVQIGATKYPAALITQARKSQGAVDKYSLLVLTVCMVSFFCGVF